MNFDEKLAALIARQKAISLSMELAHPEIQDLLKTAGGPTMQTRELPQASGNRDSEIEKLFAAIIANGERIASLTRIA